MPITKPMQISRAAQRSIAWRHACCLLDYKTLHMSLKGQTQTVCTCGHTVTLVCSLTKANKQTRIAPLLLCCLCLPGFNLEQGSQPLLVLQGLRKLSLFPPLLVCRRCVLGLYACHDGIYQRLLPVLLCLPGTAMSSRFWVTLAPTSHVQVHGLLDWMDPICYAQ